MGRRLRPVDGSQNSKQPVYGEKTATSWWQSEQQTACVWGEDCEQLVAVRTANSLCMGRRLRTVGGSQNSKQPVYGEKTATKWWQSEQQTACVWGEDCDQFNIK